MEAVCVQEDTLDRGESGSFAGRQITVIVLRRGEESPAEIIFFT